MMDKQQMAYTGRCRRCGKLCAAVMDNYEAPKITAKHVAEFIVEGLVVERMAAEYVYLGCRCLEPTVGSEQAVLWGPVEVEVRGDVAGCGCVGDGGGVAGAGDAAELEDGVEEPGAAAREAVVK